MINKIEKGTKQTITVLVKKIEKCKGKNDSIYQKVVVKDLNGVEKTMFHFNTILEIETPGVYNAEIEATEYNGGTNYMFLLCTHCNDYSIDDFAPKAKIKINDSWNNIVGYINSLPSDLQCLVSITLNSIAKDFKMAPLNANGPFARKGGLLEATEQLVNICTNTGKTLGLDVNLITAACILYYIGKLDVNNGYEESKLSSLVGYHYFTCNRILKAFNEAKNSNNEKIRSTINELDNDYLYALLHIVLNGFDGIVATTKEALVVRYSITIIEDTDTAKDAEDTSENNIIENPKAHSLKKVVRLYNPTEKLISLSERGDKIDQSM